MTETKPINLDETQLPVTVFRLTWPVIIQEAAWSVLSLIIMILIGHLGTEAVAAVALSEQIIFLPIMAFVGLSIGTTAIVARHIGANEPERTNNIVNQGMILALIMGTVFGLILWFFAEQLLVVFQASPEVIALGKDYIRVNAITIVFFFIMYSGEAALRGAGDTKTPMMVIIVMEVVGTAVAYLLINGFWFLPALGVFGAGLGKAIASVVGAILIMFYLIKGKAQLKYNLGNTFKFDWIDIKRILKVGLPSFLDQSQMTGAMSVYTIMLSSLGTTVYAAHALAMRVEMFAFAPSFGFGVAATTLVGQYLGAKKPDIAKRVGYLVMRYCIVTMVILGIVTFIFSRQLIGIFIQDPEVIAIGSLGIRIWAFALPGMAISQSLAGGLRGAGDTRWVLFLSSIGTWTMRVGGGAIMVFLFNFGAPGAWIGAVLDYTMRAVLILIRFAGNKWQKINV